MIPLLLAAILFAVLLTSEDGRLVMLMLLQFAGALAALGVLCLIAVLVVIHAHG